jgi:hypothetical protein
MIFAQSSSKKEGFLHETDIYEVIVIKSFEIVEQPAV